MRRCTLAAVRSSSSSEDSWVGSPFGWIPEFQTNPVQPVLTLASCLIGRTPCAACASASGGDHERHEAEEVSPGIPVGDDPCEGGVEACAPEIPGSEGDRRSQADLCAKDLIEWRHVFGERAP